MVARAQVTFQALALAALVAACAGSSNTLTVAGTVEIRDRLVQQLQQIVVDLQLRIESRRRRGDRLPVWDVTPVIDAEKNVHCLEYFQHAFVLLVAEAASTRTAEIRAAEADSQRSANELARTRALAVQGIASPQDLERLQSAAAAAAAKLQSVRASVGESRAARAAAQATEAIRDQLVLVAPADGIILTRFAERGEVIAAGVPVVSIGVVLAPWIRAFVGERFIARVRTGQTVRIRVDGYPDTGFAGTISEIASRAEFTPRAALTERERADLVFGIKVATDGAGGRLKAGMPVRVEIPLEP